MHRSLFAVSAFALGLLATSPAFAFSQEPINGVSGSSGGNRFLDPDEVQRLDSPAPGDSESKAGSSSPFSFSVTGPGGQGASSVRGQGNDTSHLYWDNTTNRHETYGRNSTSNRSPYGYPYR